MRHQVVSETIRKFVEDVKLENHCVPSAKRLGIPIPPERTYVHNPNRSGNGIFEVIRNEIRGSMKVTFPCRAIKSPFDSNHRSGRVLYVQGRGRRVCTYIWSQWKRVGSPGRATEDDWKVDGQCLPRVWRLDN